MNTTPKPGSTNLAAEPSDALQEVARQRGRNETNWGRPEMDSRHGPQYFLQLIRHRIDGCESTTIPLERQRTVLIEIASLALDGVSVCDKLGRDSGT